MSDSLDMKHKLKCEPGDTEFLYLFFLDNIFEWKLTTVYVIAKL